MPGCNSCGRSFVSVAALNMHKLHTKQHVVCQHCREEFKNQESVLQHSIKKHSLLCCAACKRIFSSEKALTNHLFDSPKHPKCRSCQVGFRGEAERSAHICRSSTMIEEGTFPSTFMVDGLSSPASSIRSQDLSILSNKSDIESYVHSPVSSSRSMVQNNDNVEITIGISSPPHQNISLTQQVISVMIPDEVQQPSIVLSFVGDQQEDTGSQESHMQEHTPPPSRPRSAQSSRSSLLLQDYGEEQNQQIIVDDPLHSQSSTHQTLLQSMINNSSPLLEANIPLPSESESELSTEEEYPELLVADNLPYSQYIPYQSQASAVKLPENWDLSPHNGRISKVTEEMRASWQAKCVKLSSSYPSKRSGDTRTSSQQHSRLPTIADELEEPETDTASEAGPLTFVITDPLSAQVNPGLRRRRLSLSPTLASIPEASRDLPFLPLDLTRIDKLRDCDSNTESSMGIFEHHAEDFLYDSLSDTERCQTPLTYLSAGEFPEDDGDDENEESCSEKSFSSPPTLTIENLSHFSLGLSSPTTPSDSDPFTDPFNLHPSRTNSPMNTTFPKRARAWSIGLSMTDSLLTVPPSTHVPQKVNGNDEFKRIGKVPTNVEDIDDDELDEDAITADEPPSTAIEDDLFSDSEPENRRALDASNIKDDKLENRNAFGDPSTASGTLVNSQFAEEGHPLRSIISLNTRSPMLSLPSISSSTQRNGVRSSTEPGVPLPLSCRLCHIDECKDITATFCGHIFCNECITREIMSTSKCPVCATPTLLYCLFKLHLQS